MVCIGVAVKHTMYQRKVDVDMLKAVKSVLADVSSIKKLFAFKLDTSKTERNVAAEFSL